MNDLELCRKLISIDSSFSHGTGHIAAYIVELVKGFGLEIYVQNENHLGVPQANVIVKTPGDNADKNLLLLSHLDTDSPGEYANWTHTGANPFNASINGDRLFGLGVTDAKADFACKLLALKRFKNKKFKRVSPVLVGTFGLSSGAGTIRLVRKNKWNVVGAAVGGPTDLKIATKGPGYAKVEISVPFSEEERFYKDQHNVSEVSISQSKIFSRQSEGTAITDLNKNPILKMMEYLNNLPEGVAIIAVDGGFSATSEPDTAFLEIDLANLKTNGVARKLTQLSALLMQLAAELKSNSDSGFNPPTSTVNVGMIRTHEDEIKLTGYCRLIPVNAQGRDIYDSWLEKLKQKCFGIGLQPRILDYKPPFSGQRTEFTDQVLSLVDNEKNYGEASQLCTEANVLSRLGVQSFVYGPGSALPNSAQFIYDQSIKVGDIEKAQTFYCQLIERICE